MTDTTAEHRLAERYPPPSRVGRIISAAVLVVVAVVALIWFLGVSSRMASPPVSAQLISFQVPDDQHIEMTILVDRDDPSLPATCTVYASAPDNQAVGEAPVTIPPSTERSVHFTTELRTYQRADNAHVRDCHV